MSNPQDSAQQPQREWPVLLALSAGFALFMYLTVGLTFRFSGYGEGLYDLHYIAGGWLDGAWPSAELWRPDSVVTHYYNLGLLAWGELGAMLGWSLGATYVVGLMLLPTLVFALVLGMSAGSWGLRALVAFVCTFPASGISLWLGLGFIDLPGHLQNMGHVRLVEWADRAGESWVGQTLVTGNAYPLESLGHLIFELQDLHPPVFGFLLLAVVLFWYLRGRSQVLNSEHSSREIILSGMWPGGALVLAYAVNAWMVPMLFGTVLGMLLLRREWRLGLGAVLGAAVTYAVLWWPFFRYFDAPDAVHLAFLPAEFRSNPGSWLLIWAPYLLATGWWVLMGWRTWRRNRGITGEELVFPLLFLVAVLSLEVVHLDDGYGGSFERFNSVLKTGSLAMAAWATSLLVLATRQRRLLVWLPILVLLAVPSLLQMKDLGAKVLRDSRHTNWALDASAMLDQEDLRYSYELLKREPRGVTLEFSTGTAYNIIPVVSTLAAFPTWSGWASHLGQVGAFSPEDWKIREELLNWYKQFPANNAVLDQYGVVYVLVRYELQWKQPRIDERLASLGPAWVWVPAAKSAQGDWAGYFRRARSG